jgi:hypothetical protein
MLTTLAVRITITNHLHPGMQALGRQSARSSQVGSSAGSGASEQSSTRLGGVFQLPPRAPDPPAAAAAKAPQDARAASEPGPFSMPPTPSHAEAQLHTNDDDKPFGGTGWASMPPPPAVPRTGTTRGRSPPRHATRYARHMHLRSTCA